MNNVTFGNERYQYYETVASGSGAGDGFDGTDVVQTKMTNSRLTDPEVLEWRYPVRLESYAIRRGSGGRGRWHGGDGGTRRIRFLEPMTVTTLSEPPPGPRLRPGAAAPPAPSAATGWSARTASVTAMRGCDSVHLAPGDVFVIETPGGGGFGAAVSRERAAWSTVDPRPVADPPIAVRHRRRSMRRATPELRARRLESRARS